MLFEDHEAVRVCGGSPKSQASQHLLRQLHEEAASVRTVFHIQASRY